jgi:hypothetical protein
VRCKKWLVWLGNGLNDTLAENGFKNRAVTEHPLREQTCPYSRLSGFIDDPLCSSLFSDTALKVRCPRDETLRTKMSRK